jgi:uncharacterized membrane protein YfcA
MTQYELIILIILFLVTSAVGVVTGSNSLITVPVMFQFGIDEKVAVATNMFGLTFMCIGATIPFARQRRIDYSTTLPLIGLTVVSSALGAAVVGIITGQSLKLIVSIAMFGVVAFTLLRPNGFDGRNANNDRSDGKPPSPRAKALSYTLVFLLGIYGGLYSGGYVTILTAVLVAFYGMSYAGSIAATKLINVFSSAIATIIFMWQGLVDYKLGILLGISMFAGAYIGAHYVSKLTELWLKRIFVGAVVLLAVKTLFDTLQTG